MKIIEITDKAQWDSWLLKQHAAFLQSWAWGEFQYQYGRKIKRLALMEDKEIVCAAQLLRYDLPAGRAYYFSPRLSKIAKPEYRDLFLEKIRELAPQEQVIFWRLEPEDLGIFKALDLLKIKAYHPEQSLILDLENKNYEQLLAGFHPKTRYNIKLAERKGVTVRLSTDMADLDIFYNLIEKTSRRQGIHNHPKDYYQLMLGVLGDQEMAQLYLAEYSGKVIAANLMVAYGDTMTYLHGGTDHEYCRLMAPQLLQWQAILDAQAADLKHYDFFGISESNEHWQGITRFKKGFGGRVVNYPGTFEMPLNNLWYKAYQLIKKVKA